MSTSTKTSPDPISRPVADFHPCHWGDHFLNLAQHEATHIETEEEVNQLRERVGELLEVAKEPQEQLTLIDSLERLGVAYHFEKQIDEALEIAFKNFKADCEDANLKNVSLRFRLFRQHGFYVPCDVFNKFKDEDGRFKESLASDVQGLLSLYEASHVRTHDDNILDEAIAFTTLHLETVAVAAAAKELSSYVEHVAHALHQPLHKGVPRVEARFYISVYEKDPSHNKLLLHFAKLDFNFVQSLHQKELKDLKRWWKGVYMKASFSRDRITEAYFWIIGTYFEPEFAFARKQFRKTFKLTSLLDDTYDSFGTYEELKLLTDAFQRPWNKDVAEKLPEHVKWCYHGFVETREEVQQELAKEGTAFCVDYLTQMVRELSREYMQEVEWCHQNYVPTYEEYMKVALITSPYPLAITASFVGMGEIASKECFDWISQKPMPHIVKAASTIIRLMNDMGGHKFEGKRKHVASAVQCMMEHNKISEKEAIKILNDQVEDAWKVINQSMLQPYVIPKPLLTRIINLARSAHVIYHGVNDGYTNVNQTLKDKVDLVLARPITI